MICLGKEKFDERYNISDEGIITDLNGNIQTTKKDTYEWFHGKRVHIILMWTKYGYKNPKEWDIHHLDGNKLNNNINNLKFLLHEEHARLHALNNLDKRIKHFSSYWKGKTRPPMSEEHRKHLSESLKGRHLSEEHKRKISENSAHNKATLGKHWKKDLITMMDFILL